MSETAKETKKRCVRTTSLSQQLWALGACRDAVKYAHGYKTLAGAWAACERGDWMLWLAAKAPELFESATRQEVVLGACAVWREIAAPYSRDPRVIACIETTERWARGQATLEEVQTARLAADAAAYAAGAAAGAAAAAAAAAAADAAYAAADAYAAAAAYAAADADAWRTKRAAALRRAADIVRPLFVVRRVRARAPQRLDSK